NFVLGVEADVSSGDFRDRVKDGNYMTQNTDVEAFGSARARLGYSFGRIMPYVTGGLAWARVTAGENCPPGVLTSGSKCHSDSLGPYDESDSATYFGWTLGGGLEIAIDQ